MRQRLGPARFSPYQEGEGQSMAGGHPAGGRWQGADVHGPEVLQDLAIHGLHPWLAWPKGVTRPGRMETLYLRLDPHNEVGLLPGPFAGTAF